MKNLQKGAAQLLFLLYLTGFAGLLAGTVYVQQKITSTATEECDDRANPETHLCRVSITVHAFVDRSGGGFCDGHYNNGFDIAIQNTQVKATLVRTDGTQVKSAERVTGSHGYASFADADLSFTQKNDKLIIEIQYPEEFIRSANRYNLKECTNSKNKASNVITPGYHYARVLGKDDFGSFKNALVDFRAEMEELPEPTATPASTPTPSPTDRPTPTNGAEPTTTPALTPTLTPTTAPAQCPADPYTRDGEELNTCEGDPFNQYPPNVSIDASNYPNSIIVNWDSIETANAYRIGVFYYLCDNADCSGSFQKGDLAGAPNVIQEDDNTATGKVIPSSEYNADAVQQINNGITAGKTLKLASWARAIYGSEPNPPLDGSEDPSEINNRCFCRSDRNESAKERVTLPSPTPTSTPAPTFTPTPTQPQQHGGSCYGTLSGKLYVDAGPFGTICRVVDGVEMNFCVASQSDCTPANCVQQALELMREQTSECSASLNEERTDISCATQFEAGECSITPPPTSCDDTLPRC